MSYLLYFMKMRGDNMTPEEIREKINFNNKEIAKLLDPSVFILQPEVQELLDENNELREQCSHKFENGFCIYCGKEE